MTGGLGSPGHIMRGAGSGTRMLGQESKQDCISGLLKKEKNKTKIAAITCLVREKMCVGKHQHFS